MEPQKLILKDGKQYTFSDVEIGYFRRYNSAAKSKDLDTFEDAKLAIIHRSIEQAHSEVTREILETRLLTFGNQDEAFKAALQASGAGEIRPAATS